MATMKMPGNRAQLFGGEESSFGTPPSLTAAHFMRHISAGMDYNPLNRVFSPEKKSGPGRYAIFDRRGTAGFSLEGLIRPSGTINTLPECSFVLKNAFGSVVNTTLSTTVASGSGVSGCVLTSGTGATVGAAVLITCPDGKKRARVLASVATNTVTWVPALPAGQSPSVGAAVKLGTTYKLASASPASIFLARYLYEADFTAGLNEIIKGGMVESLSLMFSHSEEPKFTANGPAQLKADAPSHPGSATQVGSNPPSSMTGESLVGSTGINFAQLAFQMTNGIEMRNDEIGYTYPTQAYRMGDRDISLSLDMAAENDFKTAVYDAAMAGTLTTLFNQVGFTEGNIVMVWAPRVEFVPPTVDVPDGEVRWPIRGRCLESTEDGNNELTLALL